MTPRRTKAYADARHLLRKHQQHHGDLRGVIARRPEREPAAEE
ncbi:hypothetical protein [Arsenicicoccus sp. oral taxon 190]|nr:hypothetical protein [Arsenicicoccus sp. oral taxon 190]